MKEIFLVVLVALFILVLILRIVRGIVGRRLRVSDAGLPEHADAELEELMERSRRPGKAREALKEIGLRAGGLESARLRAAYFCGGGHLSLNQLKRPELAVGLYLRALREDPTCIEALTKLQELLTVQRRFGRLERTYWDVLGRLDDIDTDGKTWTKCWSGLAALYSASPRKVRRADAIRKLLAACGPDDLEADAESPKPPVAAP